MADVLADALKPYIGPGAYKNLAYTNRLGEFDRTQFSPEYSLGMIRAYNDTYKLGLTDAQLVAGIQAFGTRHRNQFGVDLDAMSNPVAVAAESVERALALAGKDSGTFWAAASPYLAQGQDMAQQNWNRTSTATQLEQREATKQTDSFGDFVMAVAPAAMLAVVGASAMGWGGFAGAEAGVAAGDAMAGLIPADTGGWLVGSDGIIGSTGNAIGDAVLNNAGQSVIKSAVTGEDPLKAAVTGAAGGLISSSGVLNDVSAAITPDDAGRVATNAISRGVNAAGTNLLTTGDIGTAAEAGLTSGVGNYIGGTVAETGAPPVVAGAAGGGVAGATSAALNGTDIATGLISGAAGGGASGLASQLGASGSVASGIGSIVGGAVGSELVDDQTSAGPTPVGTPVPVQTPFAGMTFADMLPPEFVNVARSTDWGSNRLANAGRI